MRLLIPILALNLLTTASYANQQLVMHPDKRLKATISHDAMNRLAVVNDRITQVFGDQDAYEVQSEETTGQIFLKPSLDNGKKPLSVTLITESGMTQDLLLQPSEQAATTILFKKAVAVEQEPHQSMMHPQAFSAVASSFSEQLIGAMKQLVSGRGASVEYVEAPTIKKLPEGLEAEFVCAYQIGGFKGWQWRITNTHDQVQDVLEKDFYGQGDLAIAFETRQLQPHSSTMLYVVTN